MNQVELMASQDNTRSTALADFVRHGIVEIFVDLAEQIGAEWEGEDLAGAPMEIFKAQTYLLKCWDRYLEEKVSQ